jgi:hypothetical protein
MGACISPATGDSSFTAPTNVSTLFTAGANGAQVYWIRVLEGSSRGSPHHSTQVFHLFKYDGSTYSFFDRFVIGGFSVTTTSEPTPSDFFYSNLALPANGQIRVAMQDTDGTDAFQIFAFGMDF